MSRSPRRGPGLWRSILSTRSRNELVNVTRSGLRIASPHSLSGRGISLGVSVEILRDSRLETFSGSDEYISIGDEARLKSNVWICSYGGQVRIGRKVLVGPNVVILGHGGVTIGDHVMIGPGVTISAADHAYWEDGPLSERGFSKKSISVGESTWIGANSVLLAGSSIGANSVIAAGSVVRGHLEGEALYGGSPAVRIADRRRWHSEEVDHWPSP